MDLTDDESLERVENFFGNLRFADANSSPSNVILDPVIASAEIIDDDGKCSLILQDKSFKGVGSHLVYHC